MKARMVDSKESISSLNKRLAYFIEVFDPSREPRHHSGVHVVTGTEQPEKCQAILELL